MSLTVKKSHSTAAAVLFVFCDMSSPIANPVDELSQPSGFSGFVPGQDTQQIL
jgi:hypothetical protein